MADEFSFGAWVRRRRRQLDLTQAALASQIGVAAVTVQKLEADERRPSRQVAALLADALQVPAAERGAFLAAARGERAVDVLAEVGTSDGSISNTAPPLPTPLTNLIGRAAETAELRGWLTGMARLVTLTGAGGSGKTRLATQVATELREMFPGGVWFVDLSPLSDPAEVVSAVAAALQVPESPARSLRAGLLTWARDRQALLVLDNFEQVVDAAPLVSDLLRAGPALRVLVTSRVALRVEGEREYPVGPLTLPEGSKLAEIAASPAVQLFVERAQAVVPSFQLTDASAGAVAAICAALDGLPLAIELAAARVRSFPPAQLRDQIAASSLAVLAGGARTLPARQRTVRATVEWSERLLATDAQRLLARMGVFVGGCDLAALQAVCVPGLADPVGALDTLVAHSLVRAADRGGAARYTMLETVREYALERLRESCEEQALRERHAAHYEDLARQAQAGRRTAEEIAWLERLDAEHANLRAALGWCLDDPAAPDARRLMGWRIAAELGGYWLQRGYLDDLRHWVIDRVGEAQRRPRELANDSFLCARLLRFVASYRNLLGQGALADALYQEISALVQQSGEVRPLSYAIMLGDMALHAVNYTRDELQAERYRMRMVEQVERANDRWLTAWSWFCQSELLALTSGYTRGRDELERALELARAVGNPSQLANGILELGRFALYAGDITGAREYCAEALEYERRLRASHRIAVTLWNLGIALHHACEFDLNRAALEERMQIEILLGNEAGVASAYYGLADLELSRGNLEAAERQIEQALVHARRANLETATLTALVYQADIALVRGDLQEVEECCTRLLQRGSPGVLAENEQAYYNLGSVALLRGDSASARRWLRASLARDPLPSSRINAAYHLEGVAALCALEARPAAAARLWGAAEALREATGAPLFPVHRPLYERRVAAARQQLSPEQWDSAWASGRALAWRDAISEMSAYLEPAPGATDG